MSTDPFRELERLTQQFASGTWPRPSAMPMDAYREGDEYVVPFVLPGVTPESIDIDAEHADQEGGALLPRPRVTSAGTTAEQGHQFRVTELPAADRCECRQSPMSTPPRRRCDQSPGASHQRATKDANSARLARLTREDIRGVSAPERSPLSSSAGRSRADLQEYDG